jgi:AmmeMemoRadiSam system protein B
MCGFIPATVMLYAVQKLGAEEAVLVKYMTSGDVSGDYDHVVGYAGILIR